METKTTEIAPRTGEPLHKIHLLLGYATGLIWLNESLRKRYCVFPMEFYRLPKQCQKIYRCLSLWEETYLTLAEFSNILGYKPSKKQIGKRKKLIEGYLNILKTREFILDWYRVKGTRGWETKWYIQRVEKKKANTDSGIVFRNLPQEAVPINFINFIKRFLRIIKLKEKYRINRLGCKINLRTFSSSFRKGIIKKRIRKGEKNEKQK